ncbi:MAG TPA: nitroreductase family deazaflavin-dependent oxidoreductase, partial [Solirubrobacteraceae bacterium]
QMSTSPGDFHAAVIEEFRANDGRVGGPLEGTPLLLLHSAGAKSGASRVTPVAYLRDGGRYVVFALNIGSSGNPGWYHNLTANPRTAIEVGADTLPVVASEATGEERERLFTASAEMNPQINAYAARVERRIPVIVLTPV